MVARSDRRPCLLPKTVVEAESDSYGEAASARGHISRDAENGARSQYLFQVFRIELLVLEEAFCQRIELDASLDEKRLCGLIAHSDDLELLFRDDFFHLG